MNPVYVDIIDLLLLEGFSSNELFGGEWGAPHKQILVLNSGGPASELKQVYEVSDFQILVRGDKTNSDRTVYARAKAVYNYLCSVSGRVCVNDTGYQSFEPTSNLAPLGRDDNGCFIYSMNFRTYRNAF